MSCHATLKSNRSGGVKIEIADSITERSPAPILLLLLHT